MTMQRNCAALAVLAFTGAAGAHNHFTIDTTGAQIVIRVGYLPAESSYTVDAEGRVLHDGEIEIYATPDTLPATGSPVDGWYVGADAVLTSDFFAATGRLDGGDFMYEIVSVLDIEDDHDADFAWLSFDESDPVVRAISDGVSREERSFDVGFGGHEHGQAMAVSEEGVFDVELVGWDRNGVYSDSEPVIIRVSTGPGCAADVDNDGAVGFSDVLAILAAWGACEECPEDVNHDHMVDFADVLAVLAGWGPCP